MEDDSAPPPTADQLESLWNDFSGTFDSKISPMTAGSATALAGATRVFTGKSILEVGSGSGLGTNAIRQLAPKDARVVSIDISEDFMKIAKNRMAGQAVEFHKANAEDLSLFKEGTFDRYNASYVLHLTTDPLQMAKEAFRVLQPGGIAGFTVWGRKENSRRFVIPEEIMEELGLEDTRPKRRSNFHLGHPKPDKALHILKKAGFVDIKHWYEEKREPFYSPEEYVDYFVATNRRLMKHVEESDDKELEGKIKALFVEKIKCKFSGGNLAGVEALYLIGRKPLAGV